MFVKLKKICEIGVLLSFSLFIHSCKFQPNMMRTDLKSSAVFSFIEEGSIGFKRRSDPTTGDFSFSLKGEYQCRVDYWAENLSSTPNIGSPLTFECLEGQLKQSFAMSQLETGVAYSFQITIWPENLSPETALTLIYKENVKLSEIKTEHFIIARYNVPRKSTEIYTYQFDGQYNLADLQSKLIDHYKISGSYGCHQEDPTSRIFLPKQDSLEIGNSTNAPFHLLGRVASDGYGRGQAVEHPFSKDRLIQSFEYTERLQNWQWFFEWDKVLHQFEITPPGMIEKLNLINGEQVLSINHNFLGSLPRENSLNEKNIKFQLSTIFDRDISFVHISFKSPFIDGSKLFCSFLADKKEFEIQESDLEKLSQGIYDLTIAYETFQIYQKNEDTHPPWIISSQDWVHARVNKRF